MEVILWKGRADLGDEVVIKCYRHRILLVLWIPSYRPQMTSKALSPALEIPFYASFATVSTMIPGFSLVSTPSVPNVCKDEWVTLNFSVHSVGKFSKCIYPYHRKGNYDSWKEFWAFYNVHASLRSRMLTHITNKIIILRLLPPMSAVQYQTP